eukprot:1353510-Rhodomonas_salina.1
MPFITLGAGGASATMSERASINRVRTNLQKQRQWQQNGRRTVAVERGEKDFEAGGNDILVSVREKIHMKG